MYVKFIFRNKLKSLHLHNIQTSMFITCFLSTQTYCLHFTDEESDVNVPSGKRIQSAQISAGNTVIFPYSCKIMWHWYSRKRNPKYEPQVSGTASS